MVWPFRRAAANSPTPRQQTGQAAERAAERYLKKHGCRILARNVAYRQGEVDLVALEKRSRTICFVEVRSCAATEGKEPFVPPEQTVNAAKRRRIISAARKFLADRGALDAPVRFDVIAVRFAGPDRKHPEIKHFPAAFDATGR